MKALLCIVFLVAPATVLACAQEATRALPWNEAIDFKQTEHLLSASTPRKILKMADYLASVGKAMSGETPESYYVEFSDNLSGIFKPEEELWDSIGEVGAYQFSRWLEIPYVPPTVIRTLSWPKLWTERRTGSLQYFVRSSRDTSKMNLGEIRDRVGEEAWGKLVALLYPLGQWDFYAGNLILDDTNTIALIDNAAIMDLSFFRYGDRPFIYKGSAGRRRPSGLETRIDQFPYNQEVLMESPDLRSMLSIMRPYNSEARITRWHSKLDTFMDRTIGYVIWENSLWLHWRKNGLKHMVATECDPRVLAALETATPAKLKSVLPDSFLPVHLALIEQRAKQLVKACRKR